MGLQGGVLHPLGAVGLLVDEVRGGEGRRDVAQFGVQLGHDVLLRPADAGRRGVLVAVDQRGAGAHGVLRGEDGVQHLVLHLQRPDAGFRRGHGVGDDGGDPLPDEPDHVVEHPGVVRVVGVELVLGRGKQLRGRVLVGEDRLDAGNPQRVRGVDGQHAGVGVRRAQEFHVQEPGQLVRGDVQGVARRAGDDGAAGGGRDVVAQLARARLGLAHARDPGSRPRGVRVRPRAPQTASAMAR